MACSTAAVAEEVRNRIQVVVDSRQEAVAEEEVRSRLQVVVAHTQN
jgi:septum formation topological specificity factor MinE